MSKKKPQKTLCAASTVAYAFVLGAVVVLSDIFVVANFVVSTLSRHDIRMHGRKTGLRQTLKGTGNTRRVRCQALGSSVVLDFPKGLPLKTKR